MIDFTAKDIEEIYTLRLLLEVDAVHRAVKNLAEQDILDLQEIVNNLGQAMIRQDDPEAITWLDLNFHEIICLRADHSRLYNAWNSMRMQTMLLIGVTSKTHYGVPNQTLKWHQDILDAMRESNANLAEKILTDHLMDAMERATSRFHEAHAIHEDGEVE